MYVRENPQNTKHFHSQPTSALRCEKAAGEQAALCAPSRDISAVSRAELRELRAPSSSFFLVLLFVTWQTPRLLHRARDRRSPLYMRTPPSTLLQPDVVGEHTTPARSRFGSPYSNEEQRGSVLLQQGVDPGLPPARLRSGACRGYRGFQLP